MADRDRRKARRNFNSIVKRVNKMVANDNLWRGRFVIHQVRSHYERFYDGSGGTLYTLCEVIDKKTGKKSWPHWVDYLNGHPKSAEYEVFHLMNDTIVNEFDVWGNEGREALYADTTDYRKVQVF